MSKIFNSLLVFGVFALSFCFASEQTLSLIKPDAVADNHIGEIIAVFEKNGLHVAAIKMDRLSNDRAGEFYAEHKEKSFYPDLVSFMTSGPLVAIVLEGDDAIQKNRDLMGVTTPGPETIRGKYAKSKTENAVHGSDSSVAAKREISFFFTPSELLNTKS